LDTEVVAEADTEEVTEVGKVMRLSPLATVLLQLSTVPQFMVADMVVELDSKVVTEVVPDSEVVTEVELDSEVVTEVELDSVAVPEADTVVVTEDTLRSSMARTLTPRAQPRSRNTTPTLMSRSHPTPSNTSRPTNTRPRKSSTNITRPNKSSTSKKFSGNMCSDHFSFYIVYANDITLL
jgi:hypothetical protein